MRVLVATNMYPIPEAPYLGIFVQEQVHSLRALGIEVDVATHIGQRSRWAYVTGVMDLAKRLRGGRYDILHTHHTYSTILARAAMRLAGVRMPLIETFHEPEIFNPGKDYGQDLLRRLKYVLAIKAWSCRHADFVIPVQRDMLRVVLGAKEAEKIRSRVIPVGVDMDKFQPEDRAAARARLGWDPEAWYVLYSCDPARPEKRYDLARGAFERFARTRPGAQLIVGGKIPYTQMPDMVKGCDILLMPTDFETGPVVVREAMACERPVVSTDVGNVRETFEGLGGLFICDWHVEDVAAKLELAAQVRGPFGGRQRLYERELDLPQVARRVLEVYGEVLGLGKR